MRTDVITFSKKELFSLSTCRNNIVCTLPGGIRDSLSSKKAACLTTSSHQRRRTCKEESQSLAGERTNPLWRPSLKRIHFLLTLVAPNHYAN
mmetsp:Transcript_46858/g.141949  ORF Transcript_46858/g.141949 Transcript_46858/m.141949 type:complete len:92 (+) Transcript_46858:52-327(+)